MKEHIARTAAQFGAAVRRCRRDLKLTQTALGSRTSLRQATISSLESGKPGTELRTLVDVLAALDLELVIRARTKGVTAPIEDIF